MNKVDYMEVTVPNYSYVFNFEETFRHLDTKIWMTNNWTNGFYYCGIYMILIFGGQHYMSTRPKFDLRGVLSLWNTLLATFSIIGFTRTAPELIHVLRNYGFYHSICIPSFIEQDCVSGFWTWMFVLSKLPELGDTIFIVLRKQPLIFLHWYHHITVLLYSWFSYKEYTASARWFVVMNYFVHSIMYSYYALKAMRYRPPKGIAMVITTLQLAQMIIGCVINITAYQYLESGLIECGITQVNVKFSLAMYFSYFVLFAKFFHKAYLGGNGGRAKAVKKDGYANGSTEYEKLKAN
ncbi:very long chain fatty acid elongase 6-like [Lasioglossum baleicum]|uniref:very long chain fatty acid elongase 6-like n=1 Tax=Lasioglossum baleicum TaxID=434251 RepID=UPI003FCC802B